MKSLQTKLVCPYCRSIGIAIKSPPWIRQLLLLPAIFVSFSLTLYFVFAIVEDGFLKKRLSRRELHRYFLLLLLSFLTVAGWFLLK